MVTPSKTVRFCQLDRLLMNTFLPLMVPTRNGRDSPIRDISREEKVRADAALIAPEDVPYSLLAQRPGNAMLNPQRTSNRRARL